MSATNSMQDIVDEKSTLYQKERFSAAMMDIDSNDDYWIIALAYTPACDTLAVVGGKERGVDIKEEREMVYLRLCVSCSR